MFPTACPGLASGQPACFGNGKCSDLEGGNGTCQCNVRLSFGLICVVLDTKNSTDLVQDVDGHPQYCESQACCKFSFLL